MGKRMSWPGSINRFTTLCMKLNRPIKEARHSSRRNESKGQALSSHRHRA